jgi:hypothetical protein
MIITIEDMYGEQSLDLDEVSYVGSKYQEVDVLCGPRRWRLRFEDANHAADVKAEILDNLEYEPLAIQTGEWSCHLDVEDIVAIGPVLDCPDQRGKYHVVIGMGLASVSLRGSQDQLLEARSLILEEWADQH